MTACAITIDELPDDAGALASAHAVMVQLRPHIERVEDFVDQVRRQMGEGFRLVVARDASGTIRAVAGFRVMTMLFRGRQLYVDDLVTDADNRSGGVGAALFDWLVAEGRRLQCRELHLDSGVQRFDAHRFYLRQRMAIVGHHFARPLA